MCLHNYSLDKASLPVLQPNRSSHIAGMIVTMQRLRKEKPVSLGRHRRACTICAHPERFEIEQAFVTWASPAAIAQQYGLADRATVYRHAHALQLFPKRQQNIRAALERIIERVGDVEVTATAVVAAVQTLAKINAAGRWIAPAEQINLHQLFERMTHEELEIYARDGELPGWFIDLAKREGHNSSL
jgi:hypothetical protein